MFEGLATAHTCAHSTSNACSNGNLHASVRASDIGKKDLATTMAPLLPGNLEEQIRDFDHPAAAKNVQDCNRHFGTERFDCVPNAPQWSQHRSDARTQNFARNAETRSVDGFQQCHTSSRLATDDLSPAPTPKQAGNTRATCRGIVDKATASPAAQKFMTGKMCA